MGKLLNGRPDDGQLETAEPTSGFRKKVIVRELVHLKVPNHGRLFRALVKAYWGNQGKGEAAI
jgi:hypothetical protein